MDFRILGRLEAVEGVAEAAVDVAPRRAQPRALLAMFLLHPNDLLTTDRLVEALWGETPPATADKALQGHVSSLRKALGHDRLLTERGGYRLRVANGELDADRFATAVATARAIVDPAARARSLSAALAMWRGTPLADLAVERFVQSELPRLAALRLAALEAWADAEVRAGNHAAVLVELERAVAEHPLSEGLRATLMLGLYRAGRQSDALRVYREGRRLLADELGIDPGTELQLLERQILAHDPLLDLPAASGAGSAVLRQERKTVTVLVVEVVPRRATDPEDLERTVQPSLDRIRTIVEQVGGTAERIFANALLGIFGAPRAHDDDPLRAVRVALDVLDSHAASDLGLRGGIETGEALVSIDGADVAVTGQILNAASRLQATAALGSIVVGRATHRATEAAVDYVPVRPGSWVPRGFARPGDRPRPEPPFVGRGSELDQLERILARTRDGRSAQLVTINAEPGGGKSRLLRELRAQLEDDDAGAGARWLQGRCLPYGTGLTFWALGEVVRDWAGILESDDATVSSGKLGAAIDELEPDESRRTWLARGAGPLVGIEEPGTSGDREQSFAAWRGLLEAIAADSPLVIAFEDIHWADEALLAFIDSLVEHASDLPLLVLCTARPELLEARPTWGGGKRNATAILLQPLSEVETAQLLSALLGREPTPETIRRAGGNPLYAHELARVMARPDTDVRAVPESLQAVIAAHLDTLSPDLKAAAANAAVVGEVFWPGAVHAVGGVGDMGGDPDVLQPRLQRLVSNDVIRRRRRSSVAGQEEYEFLHVLVRDVAYWQIPRRDRIRKHRAVGDWIERLARDRVTNHAELIAHHYVEALDIARSLHDDDEARDLVPRARSFLALAGDAARTVEPIHSESFYRKALELTPADAETHGALVARLAEIAELSGRLAEAEALGRQAISELEGRGDLVGAGDAMISLAVTLWRLGRPETERREIVAAAIRTLEQRPPGPELVRAYARMATHELHAGRADACGEWSRKALASARGLGDPALEVQPLHHLGISRFESGDEAGIDDIREAVRLGLEAGLSLETGTAHANLAAIIWVTQGPAAALAVKRDARAFAASRGLASLARTIQAESLWQQHDSGAWDEAVASADELLATEGERGADRVTTMARTVKARILAERGLTHEAGEVERQYLDRARELGDPQDLGPALAAGAALRLAQDDPEAAAMLIAELERVTRDRDPSQRIHELPHAARVCLLAGTITVAESLIPIDGAPTYTRARLCLTAGRATIAEARGDVEAAAKGHAEAAAGWRAFGCPIEEAHALLGAARCEAALGRTGEAAASIRRARDLGRGLGAVMVIREADRLLPAKRRRARRAVPA